MDKKFEYKVDGHVSSYLPELEKGKQWKLVWADEFDGPELDESKWGFRRTFWGHEHKGYAGKEALRFDGNSCIELHVIRDGDDFKAPLLQTGSLSYDIPKDSSGFWPFGSYDEPKFMHRYGYYECRCKLQKQPGWWTAFWLQAPGIGATPDPARSGVEIDIMESFKPGVVIHNAMHHSGYGKNHKQNNIGEDVEMSLDEFHTFAVNWEPDGYTFYFDGVKRGEKFGGAVSHTEQFILLHGEPQGYRPGEGGKPWKSLLEAELPDCFTVDYVRVFDMVDAD